MAEIVPCTDEFEEYLRDESRSVGSAESIVFPESEADVRDALHALHATGVPVTVQGARSGLAAGAVPHGGCVLNTSRMNRVLGMRRGSDGRFFVRVQPGLSLMELRDMLQKASFDTAGWNDESLAALAQFKAAPAQFFAPDPTEASAALGGIVACNREVDKATAEEMSKIFLEIVLAPSFSDEALEILTQMKNIRLMTIEGIEEPVPAGQYDMKKESGGLLIQDMDLSLYDEDALKVVTEKAPTDKEMADMKMAMKVVKHIKSNGIVYVKDGATVGIGPGQTNRIWAAQNAIRQAASSLDGAVMASAAFFPFSDCVEAAAAAGITAIIQPGGSIRDQESIDKANELGIAMVFSGQRHFKH